MYGYTVVFIEPVDLDELAAAAAAAFTIGRDHIEVWDGGGFVGIAADPVLAQVAAGTEPGACAEFVGFDAFAAHTCHPTPLAVALALATRVRRRAVFAPADPEDFRWTLVAPDGSHGTVVLDSGRLDDGAIAIVGALAPIAGAPDLAIVRG